MRPEERDSLTERIIACAIAVHREVGPGLLESAYHAALDIELQKWSSKSRAFRATILSFWRKC